MRQKNQVATRSLPRLVLLPMPDDLKKWRRGPPRPHTVLEVNAEDEVQGSRVGARAFRAALRSGMDDLFALVALVRGFTASGGAATQKTTAWLERLAGALDTLDQDIEAGCLDGDVTCDDVYELDGTLDECRYFETTEDGAAEPFPWNMLNFWLQEIERRGRELVYVAVGSVALRDYQAASHAVKSLKYPLA